jgi:PTS system nitrogen regulatory IIA component
MYLASFLDARDICIEQRVLSKQQVYQMLVDRICAHHQLPSCGTKLLELILQREEEAPVAYASGIAIPHIRMEGFEDTVVAMAFLQNPIDYEGTKISWIVLIITDKTSSKTYLNIVAALLKLSKDSEAMANLAAAHDGHSVVHRLKEMAVMVKKDLFISDIMIVDPVSINQVLP